MRASLPAFLYFILVGFSGGGHLFEVPIFVPAFRVFVTDLVWLSRRLLAATRDPLPPSRQLEESTGSGSKSASDLEVRKSSE